MMCNSYANPVIINSSETKEPKIQTHRPMHACGVIAEFNPLHNGHKYLIEEARRRTCANACVVCMSGDYTQRGEPSLLPARARAAAALATGADLVLELPVSFSVSSAERFATGGVEILAQFCDSLVFGCETEDIRLLNDIACSLLSPDRQTVIRNYMQKGYSYPRAVEAALHLQANNSDLIRLPNTILGIEYCKAIMKGCLSLRPVAVKRKGPSHDALSEKDGFFSASALRRMQLSEISPFVPSNCFSLYNSAVATGEGPFPIDDWQKAVLASLRGMRTDELVEIVGVREGLETRILSAAIQSSNYEDLLHRVTSSRYPLSRIRRILLSSWLHVTQEEVLSSPHPCYARVLGFTPAGRKLLSLARDSGFICLTRARDINKLTPEQGDAFRADLRREDMYRAFLPGTDASRGGNFYHVPPLMFSAGQNGI